MRRLAARAPPARPRRILRPGGAARPWRAVARAGVPRATPGLGAAFVPATTFAALRWHTCLSGRHSLGFQSCALTARTLRWLNARTGRRRRRRVFCPPNEIWVVRCAGGDVAAGLEWRSDSTVGRPNLATVADFRLAECTGWRVRNFAQRSEDPAVRAWAAVRYG